MTPRHPRTAWPRLATALAACALAAGCGTPSQGRFDTQSATPSPRCLQHQTQSPGTKYTAGDASDPTSVLEMMRFLTANGTKAYCDGRPATKTDVQWVQLYQKLGGDPAHVENPA